MPDSSSPASPLFRVVHGWPSPPLLRPQECTSADSLAALGVRRARLPLALMRAALRLSGFAAFYRRLPERLDALLSLDSHPVNPQAPVIAAALALDDEAHDGGLHDPIDRAARLVRALLDMHAELESGDFRPDVRSGRPLESRGYLNLFGMHTTFDGRAFRWRRATSGLGILLAIRGRHFRLSLPSDFSEVTVDALRAALADARERCEASPACSNGIGTILGASPRTQREVLGMIAGDDSARAIYLRSIETIFTLCLDLDRFSPSPTIAAANAMIGNCANRWFAASTQLVVSGDARAVFVLNPGAGVAGNNMMRAAGEAKRRAERHRTLRNQAGDAKRLSLEPLPWVVAPSLLQLAEADIATIRGDPDSTFVLPDFGRDAWENAGFGPIEVFTMAVQVAAERLAGRPVVVEQFVSTSGSRCGGARTVNVSTPAVSSVIAELTDPACDDTALRTFVKRAIEEQRQACQAARHTFDIRRALHMYRARQRGLRARFVESVIHSVERLLRRHDSLAVARRSDVLISHPQLDDAVTVAGRPGVRLPYVACFSLHYQIRHDSSTLTIAQGASWSIPNSRLASEIRVSLDALHRRLLGTTEPSMAAGSSPQPQ